MQPQPKHQLAKPILDEQAFQQLLSAAYVMQEHNARLKKAPAKTSFEVVPFSEPHAEIAAPVQSEAEVPPVVPAQASTSTMQKNWASLWEMHHTEPAEEAEPVGVNTEAAADLEEDTDLFPVELEEILHKHGAGEAEPGQTAKKQAAPLENAPRRILEETALVTTRPKAVAPAEQVPMDVTPSSPWGSASKARAWLESLRTEKANRDWLRQQWEESRGNFYIVAAAFVLLVVVVQWLATPPAQPTGGPRRLSAMEQLMVSMGIAEPPPVPQEYHGNPNTKVWVDVRTGLYYCPGAELYGKSKDGKITSQLDAQRDQFQPSTLKPCD